MGQRAVKERKARARAKKRAAQNPSTPLVTSTTPPSPPTSPAAAVTVNELPEAGTNIDTHTTQMAIKGPTKGARKACPIATSDRVTRFRAVLVDSSSQSTADTPLGMTQEKADPKLVPVQEMSPGKENEASDELQPVRKSSIAIRMLLQQITASDTNIEDNSTAYSGRDVEDDSDAHDNLHEKSSLDGEDMVEMTAPTKKVGKAAASKARKKPLQVKTVQEDEIESEDEEKGKRESRECSY
jgi:hypothetical protein